MQGLPGIGIAKCKFDAMLLVGTGKRPKVLDNEGSRLKEAGKSP